MSVQDGSSSATGAAGPGSCCAPLGDEPLAPAQPRREPAGTRPSVLFVCVHNAGRSQMAAAFLEQLGAGRVAVRSAGSVPAEQVNPSAVAAMAEVGIDLRSRAPELLTADAVQDSDVVITMGCGDACPVLPGTRYLDWELDDPAGQALEAVRPIRDAIRARVQALLPELLPGAPPPPPALLPPGPRSTP